MTLQRTFRDLGVELQTLQEGLNSLHVTVVEDRPEHGDVVLVDMISDTVLEVSGLLEEAMAAAADGQQAVDGRPDLDRARHALATCHERFNSLTYRFTSELSCYERIAELAHLGRKRGGEWRAWSSTVRQALESCRQPLYDVAEALVCAWQEIAEWAGTGSVSAQAMSIGQAVTAPARSRTARQETG